MSFSTDIIQVGLSEDPINNFCLVSPIPPNGTMEVRQGHASAPGKLIATFNENGVSAPNISPVGGFKNKIINGNFAINQRAVSGTVTLAAGAYGHDRWKAGAGGCTYTFSSLVNTTAIAISAGSLQQVIEGSSLQSGTHTLSYTGTAPARINGGVWGVSGMTGTAVGGVNQTIEFGVGTVSLVQYEPGTYGTPFEHLHISVQQVMCSRYFAIGFGGGSSRSGDNAKIAYCQFPIQMRATPSVSTSPATSAGVINSLGFRSIASGSEAGGGVEFTYQAHAEL